jgi:long-chain acyl-CoA synthetase
VVIVGEGRPYLVALVSVDQAVLKELKEAGTAEISSEKPTDESVKRYIEKGIQELNRTLPSYEQIKKIAILPEDLTIDNGLLTPTQKPRRRAVMEKYRELVENLYS